MQPVPQLSRLNKLVLLQRKVLMSICQQLPSKQAKIYNLGSGPSSRLSCHEIPPTSSLKPQGAASARGISSR